MTPQSLQRLHYFKQAYFLPDLTYGKICYYKGKTLRKLGGDNNLSYVAGAGVAVWLQSILNWALSRVTSVIILISQLYVR